MMFFIFLFLFLFGITVGKDSEGHPVASDETKGEPKCDPCQQLRKSRYGNLKCVAIPYCCPGKASGVRCLLDPCIFFRTSCSRARYCVPENCHGGCSPIYYDSHLNPIDSSECSKIVLQRPKSQNRLRIEKPKIGQRKSKIPEIDVPENLISPSGTNYPKERKIKDGSRGFRNQVLLWPSHIGVNSSEKPGKCPKEDNYEIIKICTSDCSLDDHCFGNKKCCWNGCSHRCRSPQRHDPDNFLNYPIFWKL